MARYDFRVPDDHNQKVSTYLQWLQEGRTRRYNFENQWEESSSLYWPEYRGLMSFMHDRAPGSKLAQYQVDSYGSIASHRFGAIAHSMLTPDNAPWAPIVPSISELLDDRDTAKWFEHANETLWTHRYKPEANFIGHPTRPAARAIRRFSLIDDSGVGW